MPQVSSLTKSNMFRGAARVKPMCRHHWSRVVQGHAPSKNVDILNNIAAAAFWDILKHTLKETILYFAAFDFMHVFYQQDFNIACD